jgi:hypothetical protein
MSIIKVCDICGKQKQENVEPIYGGVNYIFKELRIHGVSIQDVCPDCHKEIVNLIMELKNSKEKS